MQSTFLSKKSIVRHCKYSFIQLGEYRVGNIKWLINHSFAQIRIILSMINKNFAFNTVTIFIFLFERLCSAKENISLYKLSNPHLIDFSTTSLTYPNLKIFCDVRSLHCISPTRRQPFWVVKMPNRLWHW